MKKIVLALVCILCFDVFAQNTFNDPRDGKKYKTVSIGTQIWMAENLNYNAKGSICYGNKPANCQKYGRLYDWATAMKICPKGWHLPSNAEWEKLTSYVEGNTGTTAGSYLKAKIGWDSNDGKSGNGTDAFGFSALPGGGYFASDIESEFLEAGKFGYWWSANHIDYYPGNTNYCQVMDNDSKTSIQGVQRDIVFEDGNYENTFLSVRCLKNIEIETNTEKSIATIAKTTANSLTDPRDNKTYKAVKIGTQTWMAENLNYEVEDSKCYDDNPDNCVKYGRFYNWATAMALPASCNSNYCASQIGTKHRGICPGGWHIPSDADWNVLMNFVNPKCSTIRSCVSGTDAGIKLKATSGWENDYNGTDDYGFSALPGGGGYSGDSFDGVDYDDYWRSQRNRFEGAGYNGYWWSANEDVSDLAYGLKMDNYKHAYYNDRYYKFFMISVRCVKD